MSPKEQALARLRLPAYVGSSRRDTLAGEVCVKLETPVCVAGRIVALRDHGNLLFADLRDASGRVQLVLQIHVTMAFEEVGRWLSVGDIVEAEGRSGRTQRGEVSVFVLALRPLAICRKDLAPVKAPDLRFHNRSLDLIVNATSTVALDSRARILSAFRMVLQEDAFQEFHTPVLQPWYGGGRSQPFSTRCDSLNATMFLRVTSELYLKQLVIGGFERVYEIGKCFRNEGIGKQYSPEFLMLEAYRAYAGLEEMIRLVERLVHAAQAAIASVCGTVADRCTLPGGTWQSLSYREACEEFLGVSWDDHADFKAVTSALASAGLGVPKSNDIGTLHLKVLEVLLAPQLHQPTVVKYLPAATSPLMRRRDEDPNELERAWAFLDGVFFCDIALELNDPDELMQRLRIQRQSLRGVHELSNECPDFLRALELGMPPIGGIGLGVERCIMALIGENNIREVIPFPLAYVRAGQRADIGRARRPRALRPGSRIAVIAPSAGLISRERLERGLKALRELGWLPVVFGVAGRDTNGIAGTPEERVGDLHAAFADPEIQAVLTLYGGYNTNELLPLVDWELLAENPKILCGYSDTTALLLAAHERANLVVFHGPAVLPELGDPVGVDPFTLSALLAVLQGFEGAYPLKSAPAWYDEYRAWGSADEYRAPVRKRGGWRWLRTGSAEGILVGGHLRTMEILAGTDYAPQLAGRIVFLEDAEVGVPQFRRSVVHLQQCGILQNVAGVVIGHFGRTEVRATADMENLIAGIAGEDVPVLSGVDLGHTDPMLTLPIGTRAVISSDRDEFLLTECPVDLVEDGVSINE